MLRYIFTCIVIPGVYECVYYTHAHDVCLCTRMHTHKNTHTHIHTHSHMHLHICSCAYKHKGLLICVAKFTHVSSVTNAITLSKLTPCVMRLICMTRLIHTCHDSLTLVTRFVCVICSCGFTRKPRPFQVHATTHSHARDMTN